MKSFKLGNVTVNNNQGIRILPDLYVGDNGEFPSGSILDANATSEFVEDKVVEIIGGEGVLDDVVRSQQIDNIVFLTQQEFDALTEYDPNTEYNII